MGDQTATKADLEGFTVGIAPALTALMQQMATFTTAITAQINKTYNVNQNRQGRGGERHRFPHDDNNHRSSNFDDSRDGPPPRRLKEESISRGNFTRCNNKEIGAKFVNLNKINPKVVNPSLVDDQRDIHTTSTTADRTEADTNLYGKLMLQKMKILAA